MNLTSPTQVRSLLTSRGVSPNRTLGQNFLIDRNILNLLLDAADLHADETVLEIGPGLGVVTQALATRVARVLAVEKDRGLSAWLRECFADSETVRLAEGDALEVLSKGVFEVGETAAVGAEGQAQPGIGPTGQQGNDAAQSEGQRCGGAKQRSHSFGCRDYHRNNA